jgi:hypothetical protein
MSILNDPPPPVPDQYSEGISYIMNELLNKNKDQRMGMAEMLSHRLFRLNTFAQVCIFIYM